MSSNLFGGQNEKQVYEYPKPKLFLASNQDLPPKLLPKSIYLTEIVTEIVKFMLVSLFLIISNNSLFLLHYSYMNYLRGDF